MFRWFAVCLLLAASTVALMIFITQFTGLQARDNPGPAAPRERKPNEPGVNPEPERQREPRPAEARMVAERPTLVAVNEKPPEAVAGNALVIPMASVVAMDKQDVPAEKDGKLIFLATEIDPAERDSIPPSKRLTFELGFLAIEITAEEFARTPESERVVFADNNRTYRRWKESDKIEPNRVVLARQRREFRRLEAGDRVKEGQLLALVNPALALDELSVKTAKLDAAEADRLSSMATKEESQKRVDTIVKARQSARGSVSDDEYRGAVLTVERYRQEEVAKTAAVWQSQREVNQALTALKMHEIRAAIPGTVKTLYKGRGDAVKALESVMQIQNPNVLHVEGKVEAQEAKQLRKMLHDAKAERRAISVMVDASQMEAPKQVLKGHLYEITGVAVSKGPQPVIVSASADRTVRVWARPAGQDRWYQHAVLSLDSVPRAVACSPKDAKANLLAVGTSVGDVRLFDLDKLKEGERRLPRRHGGPITCVAFSPDGSQFATAGEDHAIHLWSAAGDHLRSIRLAHADIVTSLQFAGPTRLVSAGRDGQMVVWDVKPGVAPTRFQEFDRRTGDVPVLGVSPDGKMVLIDQQSEEMRVLSVEDRHIIGTLQSPPNSGNFATMALFSPDGKTVLTNSTGGRGLQLWRASSQQGRGAEVRQFVWTTGAATCGAFDPNGTFAVTGTADSQVLVWAMPDAKEVDQRLTARLTYVEDFLDSSQNKVQVRAELENPGWIIPGPATRATLVVPFAPPAR
jgi:WD40 repeat protein